MGEEVPATLAALISFEERPPNMMPPVYPMYGPQMLMRPAMPMQMPPMLPGYNYNPQMTVNPGYPSVSNAEIPSRIIEEKAESMKDRHGGD